MKPKQFLRLCQGQPCGKGRRHGSAPCAQMSFVQAGIWLERELMGGGGLWFKLWPGSGHEGGPYHLVGNLSAVGVGFSAGKTQSAILELSGWRQRVD